MTSEYQKKWQNENKDKLREYQKQWIANNKDRLSEYYKEWRKTPIGKRHVARQSNRILYQSKRYYKFYLTLAEKWLLVETLNDYRKFCRNTEKAKVKVLLNKKGIRSKKHI